MDQASCSNTKGNILSKKQDPSHLYNLQQLEALKKIKRSDRTDEQRDLYNDLMRKKKERR